MTHSVMPFITEELWNKLTDNDELLISQSLLFEKELKIYSESKNNIDHLIEIITSIRKIRTEFNIPYKTLINLEISNTNNKIINFFKDFQNEITRLLKTNNIIFNSNASSKIDSAHLIINETTILIPLKGKKKYLNELQNLETKLSNTVFLEKAPPKIVDQFNEDALKIKSSIEKLDQIINTIS